MLTGQFERQIFMKAQQTEIHAAQQEAAELNAQRQTLQAVLKDTTEVLPYFIGLEQTLVDNEIPEAKWLQALQSCIKG